ncbi:hypothetical protein JY651_35945 [Pyxidicoccus parkwayensis]|uniref:Lipoprotein n=1 Tax=Pyxidicoccus parkwayensis TaxID=2813578 RepID=A0ABX7NP16_9BACT|nr:hypothetical protein [Pyxidicoccus parkwaysis]QSQ20592.1 hypothetical protein JY651_35945 [Pyxidicoccus parkwaysis]
MGRWQQWLVAAIAILAVLVPGAGRACPSPPTTWNLVRDTQLIVLGRVVESWDVGPIPEDTVPPFETEDERLQRELIRELTPRQRARLEVREVWKGAAEKSLIVASNPTVDTLTSITDHGPEDSWHLLFLYKVDGVWQVFDAEADKRLEEHDVAAWRERVKEARTLQARDSGDAQARREWNALGLLHRATRGDALEEVHDRNMPWRESHEEPLSAPGTPLVSRVTQRRIASSVIADPYVQHSVWTSGLPGLLLLLNGYADPDLDRIAASLVDPRLGDIRHYPLSATQDALDLLSVRFGVGGEPGTERCDLGELRDEEAEPIVPCVRARWERIRALHAQQ